MRPGRVASRRIVEDLLVDPRAVGGDPHLVVLGADPGVEVGGGPSAVRRGASISLLELRGDRHLLVVGRGGQVEVVEVEQPGQLGDRVGVVVDPQVDGDVVEAAVPGALADDEQRGRLPARAGRRRRRRRPRAPPAAGGPAARRRRWPRQASSIASTTSLAGQDVALDRVAVAGDAAGPVEAGVAGVGGGAAVDVDDADLAVVAALVLLEQPLQGDRGGGAVVEVGQGLALVGDVGVGLGGDGADPGDGGRARPTPTARNLEATATPHDSPSAERATIEKVMARP